MFTRGLHPGFYCYINRQVRRPRVAAIQAAATGLKQPNRDYLLEIQ